MLNNKHNRFFKVLFVSSDTSISILEYCVEIFLAPLHLQWARAAACPRTALLPLCTIMLAETHRQSLPRWVQTLVPILYILRVTKPFWDHQTVYIGHTSFSAEKYLVDLSSTTIWALSVQNSGHFSYSGRLFQKFYKVHFNY